MTIQKKTLHFSLAIFTPNPCGAKPPRRWKGHRHRTFHPHGRGAVLARSLGLEPWRWHGVGLDFYGKHVKNMNPSYGHLGATTERFWINKSGRTGFSKRNAWWKKHVRFFPSQCGAILQIPVQCGAILQIRLGPHAWCASSLQTGQDIRWNLLPSWATSTFDANPLFNHFVSTLELASHAAHLLDLDMIRVQMPEYIFPI